MKLNSLKLTNFRNHKKIQLDFENNITFIIGSNGVGKTSILEAIYMLALTKSHRVSKDFHTISYKNDFAKIEAITSKKKKLELIITKAGKKANYNGINFKKLSEFVKFINVVMFSPEDLDIIKGNPKQRRNLLNIELTQVSSEYFYENLKFRKLLKERNAYLKNVTIPLKDKNFLDILTERLCKSNINIVKIRKNYISKLNKIIGEIYSKISPNDGLLTMGYKTHVSEDFDKLYENFKSKYDYDIITSTTNIGIHRDDLIFKIDNKSVKDFASQGQQRSVILSLKLSILELIYEFNKDYPILLLDDVMSELDIVRQNNLLNYLGDKVQTIVTTTHLENINNKILNKINIKELEGVN